MELKQKEKKKFLLKIICIRLERLAKEFKASNKILINQRKKKKIKEKEKGE